MLRGRLTVNHVREPCEPPPAHAWPVHMCDPAPLILLEQCQISSVCLCSPPAARISGSDGLISALLPSSRFLSIVLGTPNEKSPVFQVGLHLEADRGQGWRVRGSRANAQE